MKTLAKLTAAAIVFSVLNLQASAAPGDNNSDEHVVTISIPEIALLDLEGNTDVVLQPESPTEAGLGMSFASATNSNVWIV